MRQLCLVLLLLLAACSGTPSISTPVPQPDPNACVAGAEKKDQKPAEDGGVGGTGQAVLPCPDPSE